MPKPKPRIVRVKPSSYTPTKAEMEAPITLPPKPGGGQWTPEEVALACLQPVQIVEDPDA